MGTDFTLFLTHSGDVLGCGSNMQRQLGIKGITKAETPTLIYQHAQQIAATYAGSILVTENEMVATGKS